MADVGDLGVPSFGGCNEGGGTLGDRNVYLQDAEHGGTVHSYLPHSVPMPRCRDETRIVDTGEVVGSIGPDITRDSG